MIALSLFAANLQQFARPAPAAAVVAETTTAASAAETTEAQPPAAASKVNPDLPVSTAFIACWSWIKSAAKSAYKWTEDKIKTMGTWVAETAVYQTVTGAIKSATSWTIEKIVAGHEGLKSKSTTYTWVCDKLNRVRLAVITGVLIAAAYVVAAVRFVGASLAFAGLWVLNKIDMAYLVLRTMWRGEKVESVTDAQGNKSLKFTAKDGATREVTLPLEAVAVAPSWTEYRPLTLVEEALVNALTNIEIVLSKTRRAAAAGATAAAAAFATGPVAAAQAPVAPVVATAPSHVTAAPAVKQAQKKAGMKIGSEAIVPASDALECGKFFYDLHLETKRVLQFNPAWGTRANCYQGLIDDPEAKVTVTFAKDSEPVEGMLQLGEIAKAFDEQNHCLMVVATRLGLVVIWENGDKGEFVYNATPELAASGVFSVGGKSTLADLQYILGAQGKPNLGQTVEALYDTLLNAQPTA